MTARRDGLEPVPGQRVVVVGAHPDDADFSAGGTVALWTAAGIEVSYCVVTDGQQGGFDPGTPRSEIPTIRREEQRTSARALGVEHVVFLGYQDGCVTPELDLRRDISRVIREVRPNVVVCHSPERDWDHIYATHPDHLAVGTATLAAIYPDARNPFSHPELSQAGLEPHAVSAVWLFGGPKPAHHVDVTAVFEQKLGALRCHESQVAVQGSFERTARAAAAEAAERADLLPGSFAEAFQVVDTGGPGGVRASRSGA